MTSAEGQEFRISRVSFGLKLKPSSILKSVSGSQAVQCKTRALQGCRRCSFCCCQKVAVCWLLGFPVCSTSYSGCNPRQVIAKSLCQLESCKVASECVSTGFRALKACSQPLANLCYTQCPTLAHCIYKYTTCRLCVQNSDHPLLT